MPRQAELSWDELQPQDAHNLTKEKNKKFLKSVRKIKANFFTTANYLMFCKDKMQKDKDEKKNGGYFLFQKIQNGCLTSRDAINELYK